MSHFCPIIRSIDSRILASLRRLQGIDLIGHGACVPNGSAARRWATADHPNVEEAFIRTLSVSLVAVAAIAASLLLSRSRDEEDATRLVPAGEQQPARLPLDAIRAAGL
jgi:hypothetical protein